MTSPIEPRPYRGSATPMGLYLRSSRDTRLAAWLNPILSCLWFTFAQVYRCVEPKISNSRTVVVPLIDGEKEKKKKLKKNKIFTVSFFSKNLTTKMIFFILSNSFFKGHACFSGWIVFWINTNCIKNCPKFSKLLFLQLIKNNRINFVSVNPLDRLLSCSR